MLEIYNQDIFKIANSSNEAICITTNGLCKSNGDAVMGKGIAKTANDYFHLSTRLGEYLRTYGNRAFDMGLFSFNNNEPYHVLTFPTKHHWKYPSDINLIKTSAEQIVQICDKRGITKCYLPPVGCANGKLDYETVVKPVLK